MKKQWRVTSGEWRAKSNTRARKLRDRKRLCFEGKHDSGSRAGAASSAPTTATAKAPTLRTGGEGWGSRLMKGEKRALISQGCAEMRNGVEARSFDSAETAPLRMTR